MLSPKSLIKSLSNTIKDCYHYVRFPYAFVAYRGVFKDFASAFNAVPKTRNRGLTYNQAEPRDINQICENYAKPIKLVDTEYPIFFWLDRILQQNPHLQVCDFGGGDGRHYFAFTQHSSHKLQWDVCELEQNVKLGNTMAQKMGIDNLHFSQTPNDAQIFLSSSAFQYIENLYNLLEEYLTGGGAEHILLTRLPLQNNAPTFVTLQNALNQFYTPFRIFNRFEFIDFFIKMGYELVDEWKDPFDCVIIPFHRNISVTCSWGMYFRKIC